MDAAHRAARIALYLGIALFALGWLVLYLGYNGAATHPQEPAQLPYILSGGFGGGALIVIGGIMVLVHVLLGVQRELQGELRDLREALEDLTDAIARSAVPGASSNGAVVVLRGGSSFHRPECRLVAHRPNIRRIADTEATRRGLVPCRVCKP